MPERSAKRTIGFFDDSVGPGGTTRYLSNLISGLDRDEFDLVLLALTSRAWHRELEPFGLRIVTLAPPAAAGSATPAAAVTEQTPPTRRRRIQMPKWIAAWLGLLKEIVQLRRLFRKCRVDLLHSNNAGAEPAPIAARLAGVPIVLATWHVDSTYDLEGTRSGLRYRLLEMACMRSLHHAISVSHATAADWVRRCHLPKSYGRKITVIHNGIAVDSLRRRVTLAEAKAAAGLAQRLVVGSTGRLEPAKGYEFVIRALPAIVAKYPQTLLRIAGRGELQTGLAELARSLGVEGNLEFTGFVSDIQSFLETLDIYVQPSLCEALPMAVLEACAVGMPVVASDVGGVGECIRQNRTGIVVPARDPQALSEAVVRLLEDAQLRERMALEGQMLMAEGFRKETMVAETVAVYRRLFGSERSGASSDNL
jgi:glycosyltransferase involved in cell wall biosynthesis